jgi:hypothetical protein
MELLQAFHSAACQERFAGHQPDSSDAAVSHVVAADRTSQIPVAVARPQTESLKKVEQVVLV